MSPDHITILTGLDTGTSRGHILYYYQGNFYHPMSLSGGWPGKVKKAIRIFTRENREMVQADQAENIGKKIATLCEAQGIHPDILTVIPSAGAHVI